MTTPTQSAAGILASRGAGQLAEFSWGAIEWLFNGELAPGAEQTLGYVEIAPGQKNPLHAHPNCEELLYLIEGELDHSLEGEVYRMQPGQAIRVPAGAQHDARNVGATTARMVIIYSDPARQMVTYEGTPGQE
jgi:quercetin dioxygenase-like cupin family protein